MTPQQANLAPCPFCGGAARIHSNNDWHRLWCSHTDDCMLDADEADLMYPAQPGYLLEIVEVWNRRAPAPTEPAVDRDAVKDTGLPELREHLKCAGIAGESITLSHPAAWALYSAMTYGPEGLATPASPAVPEPAPLAPRRSMSMFATLEDYRAAQASQATSAGEFPGVNSDRAHGIMAGYNPKPPPPRPQRPPGPLWTDAERERFRENMKRGERCPICSVIEGGLHFPGCSRGVP